MSLAYATTAPSSPPNTRGQNVYWHNGGGRVKLQCMLSTRLTLIERVRNPRDAAAWSEFVSLYQPLLLNFVRKHGLHNGDADDVVQEIFIALLKRLQEFEVDHSRGRFRTYLWQTTHNAVINFHRKKKRRPEGQLDEKLAALQQASEADPDDEFVKNQRQRVLEFALSKVKQSVPAQSWACFEARILRQRPAKEIASELGITANAVYVYASRVLTSLREKCAEYLEELVDD